MQPSSAIEMTADGGGVMTTAEKWRLADLSFAAPAHLIRGLVADAPTACGWHPPTPGVLLTRAEMLTTTRFACSACLNHAARTDRFAAENGFLAHNNVGGRS